MSLNQASNSFLTPKQQISIDFNRFLRQNKVVLRFIFKKADTNRIVTSHKIDQLTIEGKIDPNSKGDYSYAFKIKETDDTKKKKLEDDLFNLDIAIKHLHSRTIVSREKLVRLPYPDFGGEATLDLKD